MISTLNKDTNSVTITFTVDEWSVLDWALVNHGPNVLDGAITGLLKQKAAQRNENAKTALITAYTNADKITQDNVQRILNLGKL
jgi:hypothetical protein